MRKVIHTYPQKRMFAWKTRGAKILAFVGKIAFRGDEKTRQAFMTLFSEKIKFVFSFAFLRVYKGSPQAIALKQSPAANLKSRGCVFQRSLGFPCLYIKELH
ncbi:MAG: hypothetical protein MR437_03700 [Clostridiales bacterium]|nr:hypothetical protein [Clostridiales bacterium]